MSVNSVLINAATTHYVQTQLEDIVALATTVMKEMDSHVKTLMNVQETLTSVIQMLNAVIQLGAMSASAELAILAMDSIVQILMSVNRI
jgi:hypothetical protein